MTENRWPSLDLPLLTQTMDALHLWTQIVGKVKIACLPWLNESWHVPLYVDARGLTSGLVTYDGRGFEMAFDFQSAALRVLGVDGAQACVELRSRTVSSFHADTLEALRRIGISVTFSGIPSEIPDATPFAQDDVVRDFDIETATAFWRSLVQVQRVFHRFRSRFDGKCSPIHFFWGSFDLAVTRFSGRPAPEVNEGGPGFPAAVARDAYAGEQVGCGFWPGGRGVDGPSFYIEAWPSPPGFADAPVGPAAARFVPAMGEWVMSYDAVREADDPDACLLQFLQSGYEAVAEGGGWDRMRLDRTEGPVGHPPPI